MKRSLVIWFAAALIGAAGACSADRPAATPETTSATVATTTTLVTTSAPVTTTAPASTTAPVTTTAPASTTAPVTTTAPLTTTGTTPAPDTPSAEYCAKNQDPTCPAGSYIGPDAIPNPNGDGTWVPCEGTICTNPNHGAGDSSEAPADGPRVDGGPCEDGAGTWVHLTGDNAAHYGTEWLCHHP